LSPPASQNTANIAAYGNVLSTISANRRLGVSFPSCDADSEKNPLPKLALHDSARRRDSMTDTFRPSTTITDQDIKPLSVHRAGAVGDYARFAPPAVDGTEEDDGAINCICGFNEDDGNTVACDHCNRWQHIICYYPEYGDSLPDDLSHYCVECSPQKPVNRQDAFLRQRKARDQRQEMQNGVKRPPTKSHKKKVKDTTGAAGPNGLSVDKLRHDRNSASPRDQPPPAKRPKTNHRSSNSTANALAAQSRKRNGSTVNHQRSTSLSPDAQYPLYTDEFIRAYREDDYNVPPANVTSLGIYNAMSGWLTQPEELYAATNGAAEVHDIFQRWDGDISVIDSQSVLEIRETQDPAFKTADGQSATWKYATVTEPLQVQACIGELRGRLEFKNEYMEDPANRWSSLRHPEPFVFFHGALPICIDARHEGTAVRYIRRSCVPNAELKIIITGNSDYHFCFIALRDIEPGEEITVAWDSASTIRELLSRRGNNSTNGISSKDVASIQSYVSTILANCGPCACGRDATQCLMARFDRRDPAWEPEDEPIKVTKQSNKRKKAHHVSPLNTHALNSRSGSEARKLDADDEPTDSRSASGSAGRGSISRDITPNTHYSTNGSGEMSERERKKLAQYEELFSKQDTEGKDKQAKKKRSSAGSALNTPSVASSTKTLGLPGQSKYADAGTVKQSGLPAAKRGRPPKSSGPSKTTTKATSRAVKVAKPTYTSSSVQCDMDEEEAAQRPPLPPPRRTTVPLQQRLLERCARNNAMRKQQQLSIRSRKSSEVSNRMDVDEPAQDVSKPTSPSSGTSRNAPNASRASPALPAEDVEMKDAEAEDGSATITKPRMVPEASSDHYSPPPAKSSSPAPAHPPADPPAPPWRKAGLTNGLTLTAEPVKAPRISSNASKSPEMHLTMPPPPANPFSAASAPHLTVGGSLSQSPAGLTPGSAPIFSPNVAASVNPSPARKKLSLSDYTRRSKAKDKDSSHAGGDAKVDRESSPASVASGPANPSGAPVAPGLEASNSEITRAKESGTAIDDSTPAPGA